MDTKVSTVHDTLTLQDQGVPSRMHTLLALPLIAFNESALLVVALRLVLASDQPLIDSQLPRGLLSH
jgi:hypothetical protein